LDVTFQTVRLLAALGLVWDVILPEVTSGQKA
jgi:hypothetical protein